MTTPSLAHPAPANSLPIRAPLRVAYRLSWPWPILLVLVALLFPVFSLTGCSKPLPETTWAGTYRQWKVELQFVDGKSVKKRVTAGSYITEDLLEYRVEGGNLLLLSGGVTVSRLRYGGGQMVASPAELQLATTTADNVVLERVKRGGELAF